MITRIQAMSSPPNQELVAQLERLIFEVVQELDNGRDCSDAIAVINELSGFQGYVAETFHQLYSWTSEQEFAEIAAKGKPPSFSDLSLEEVTECLRFIRLAEEPNSSFYRGVLEQSFPALAINDLIYWPDVERETSELAAEIFRLASEESAIRPPAASALTLRDTEN